MLQPRPERLSARLGVLAKEGLLEKTRGALVLPDPSALNRRFSHEGLWVDLD